MYPNKNKQYTILYKEQIKSGQLHDDVIKQNILQYFSFTYWGQQGYERIELQK